MKTVVRYTKFESDPYGDGGAKRSEQIKEFWQSCDVKFIEEKFILPKQYSVFASINWVLRSIHFITKYVGWSRYKSIVDKYKAILIFALRIPIVYDKYKGVCDIFIWESTFDYASLYLMKATGAKIIAYPHNLESLVPVQMDPITHKLSPYWLYEEIERLKLCDEVYCISKEETWLLQIFGISAHYYPYYPPKNILSDLKKIKIKRKQANPNKLDVKREYLILGSATNPPTKIGMQQLIDYFSLQNNLSFVIHVAGYNTEILKYKKNLQIQNHGTISKEDLLYLLINVDGIIINQPTTSGALTRIVENRIAGIPIYANFGAARDFYNLSDIYIYETFEELQNLLLER